MSKKNNFKKNLESFNNSSDYHRARLLESLAYICFSVGNQAREEADELFNKHNLVVHDIKFFANNLTAAFNQYNTTLKVLYPQAKAYQLCEDYEKVRKALYVFAGLEDKDNSNQQKDTSNEENQASHQETLPQ